MDRPERIVRPGAISDHETYEDWEAAAVAYKSQVQEILGDDPEKQLHTMGDSAIISAMADEGYKQDEETSDFVLSTES